VTVQFFVVAIFSSDDNYSNDRRLSRQGFLVEYRMKLFGFLMNELLSISDLVDLL
jgi:hypothetical protein